MMAQRFPGYFDGIIAGAPAYAMTRLLTGGALLHAAVDTDAGYLGSTQLALIQRHVLQSCGKGAAYLEDPRQCHPDLAALQCADGANEDCLSAAQRNTAQMIYTERKDPLHGDPLYAVLPGAEAVKGSWDLWLMGKGDKGTPVGTNAVGTEPVGMDAVGMAFTWNYLAYMVMGDPKLDMATVTTADLERGERDIGAMIDAVNPDLSAFKAHGGKLIQYHGWNDPAIPAGYSLEYRERLAAKTKGVNDFYRLYMVPGMLHCGGGDAPTNVNWQAALEDWVERGVAPAALTARDAKGATQTLQPVE
jgi:feruloyl esterase